MEDFVSILERDYGLKPQGKLAPMSNLKQTPLFPPVAKSATVGNSRYAKDNRSSAPVLAEDDTFSSGAGIKSSSSGRRNTPSGFDPPSSGTIFDDAFTAATSNGVPSVKAGSPLTAFDAPLYDDDIFGGMPGIRGANSAFEDVFNMGSTAAAPSTTGPACHDDLMGGSGIDNKKTTIFYEKASAGDSAVDDLLPGFDPAEPLKPPLSDARELSQHNNSTLVDAFSSNIHESPFTVFNSDDKAHPDYLASSFHVGHPEAKGTKSDKPFNSVEGTQTSTTSLNFENDPSHQRKDLNIAIEAFQQPKNSKSGFFQAPSSGASEVGDCNDMAHPVGIARDDVIARDHKQDTIIQTSAEFVTAGSASQSMKSVQSGNAHNSFKSRVVFQGSADSYSGEREESHMPKVGKSGRMDEYWLTMNDIKLVTQRSTAPPPGRPPPVPVSRQGHEQQKSFPKKMSIKGAAHLSTGTSVEGGMNARKLTRDDLDSFVSGNLRKMDADVHEFKFGVSSPGNEEQGSAAATASGVAMWQAIKMAEAKLRQAKEAKDKDKAEVQGLRVKEEDCAHDNDQSEGESVNNKDMREKQRRERNLRHMQTEKKSGERELEAKKDKANEIARQSDSVERVDGEVQEREFSRAAERTSEARRNADEKATAEAQERHELAAEEKLRSERITTADREKSEKDRMADLREQQTISRQHLESFFMPNSRPTSAPKQRTKATDGIPSNQGLWRSTHSSSTFKKVQSVPSMAEDLTSLFGGPLSGSDTFQEVDGESADRRKFRWDRYQSTLERAAKALEEKHQRDLQIAKDQEERHRASELLDSEIKRWAAGKEGNLRALLSTLHYVLWPECGWQPVSLTELITPAAVKKVYKKATLYVHPDKMQQKRATNQQKYIAEKVFDLLMEAWKKFNSQELF